MRPNPKTYSAAHPSAERKIQGARSRRRHPERGHGPPLTGTRRGPRAARRARVQARARSSPKNL